MHPLPPCPSLAMTALVRPSALISSLSQCLIMTFAYAQCSHDRRASAIHARLLCNIVGAGTCVAVSISACSAFHGVFTGYYKRTCSNDSSRLLVRSYSGAQAEQSTPVWSCCCSMVNPQRLAKAHRGVIRSLAMWLSSVHIIMLVHLQDEELFIGKKRVDRARIAIPPHSET